MLSRVIQPVITPVVRKLSQAIKTGLFEPADDVGGFTPASLFAGGVSGFEAMRITTSNTFSDVGGTTPATVNGLVASIRSGGGDIPIITQSNSANQMRLRGTPTGANLMAADGNFFTPANWTLGAGWSITDAMADAVSATGNFTYNISNATAGKLYLVRYTVVRTAGSVTLNFGGTAGVTRSASATYEEYITATNTNALDFTVSTFSGSVNNIMIWDADAGSVGAPYFLFSDGGDFYSGTNTVSAYPFTLVAQTRDDRVGGVFGAVALTNTAVDTKILDLARSIDWNASTISAYDGEAGTSQQKRYTKFDLGEFTSSFITDYGNGLVGTPVANTNVFGTKPNFFVGEGRGSGGSWLASGRIYGFGAFGKSLSTTERQNLEQYNNVDSHMQAWGDSMTAGSGTAIAFSYPLRLEQMTGYFVDQKGAGGESSAAITARFVADTTEKDRWIQLLCMGTNDTWNVSGWSPTYANIETCIAGTKGRKRWIVIPPYRAEGGTTTKAALDEFDAYATATWGNRFCNVRAYLMTQGDGSANDLADIADGLVPRSLRSDTIHLNDKGYQLKAAYIHQHIIGLGWI
jgi:lysophospholipase L1-like esterase